MMTLIERTEGNPVLHVVREHVWHKHGWLARCGKDGRTLHPILRQTPEELAGYDRCPKCIADVQTGDIL